ncbi:MAG: hypothetical protein ACJ0FV_05195 [Gammaproteobacteria bacterium]
MKKNILFIGYGDLGSRLASIGQDDLVITGISRSLKPTIIPDQYHSLDWFKNSAQKVDLLKHYDCLVITLTPTSFDEVGYEKGYEEGMKLISRLVKNISFKKSLLISSTRVYKDSEEPITELSNVNSEDFRAKSLLESEAIYSKGINSLQKTIFRLSGLYDPEMKDKILYKQVDEFQNKLIPISANLNRLSRDQAARTILNFCIKKTDLLLLNVSEPTVLAKERFNTLFPEKDFDDFFRVDNPGKQLDISNLLKSKLLDG